MERRLLQKIESFLKETRMAPTAFGRAAVRDPRLVADLRAGREPGSHIICRAEHFMNIWSADLREGRLCRQTASRDDRR